MIDRVCSLLKMKKPALNSGFLFASGTAVPTGGTSGYQTGCLYQKTDGAAGTALYINEGDETSANFQAVSGLTAAQEALLSAVAGVATANKAVILDENAHVDAVKTAGLSLGATGAEVAVTATAAQLNTLAGASAGIAAVLAGGLGGSDEYPKTTNTTEELIAAHGTKARAVLVVAVVTEVFANGTGGQPTFTVGEADTLNKFFATTDFTDAALNTVLVAAGTNTATKNISVTGVAATGDGTGALAVTTLAIPTT